MLRTPAFVDRMELPDDADGRVVVFSVDGDAPAIRASAQVPRRAGHPRGSGQRIAAGLDSRYAAPALAMMLVVLFLLGMLLLKR